MFRLAGIMKAKFSYPALPPPDTFAGQTVLITGATSGLGFATAVHFVCLGASRVIITGRTLSRARAAASQIETQTGAHGVVEARALDMDTFAGVQEFANALMRDVHTIDVVLLNAGLLIYEFETSPEGWEKALQVSALSTPLLALMLVPWMRRTKSTNGQTKHLSATSSSMAMLVDLSDTKFPRHDVLRSCSEEKHFISFQQSYNRSRLFLEYAVAEIADMLRDKNGHPEIIINTLCPGAVRTLLARPIFSAHPAARLLYPLISPLVAKTAEQGARTCVAVAMSTPAQHGLFMRYYGDAKEYAEQRKRCFDTPEGQDMKKQVWTEICQVLEAQVPGVVENAKA